MGRQENVFVDGMEKHRPGCYRGGFQGNEIARVSVTDVRQRRKDRLPGAECERPRQSQRREEAGEPMPGMEGAL